MVHCIKANGDNDCFWADYNPETGNHEPKEEPDFLRQKNPKTPPPMMRVMQKCGKGRSEWKAAGPMGHSCPEHVPFTVEYERQKEARDKAFADGKAAYTGVTSRNKIADRTDMFTYMSLMYEDSKIAYDWLLDIYGSYGDADLNSVLKIFANLNDMNIRGKQIDVIIARWFPGYPAIEAGSDFRQVFEAMLAEIEADPQAFIDYINENFDKSDIEEAVLGGATIYGHL